MIKPLILALSVVFTVGNVNAQTNGWQPSPGHTQVPIWPGAVPDARPVVGPEIATTEGNPPTVVFVSPVARPTMTVYSPSGTNTGVAMIVFPGGGYNELAMDLEGTEICDWLTSQGITAVLLKYRVPGPKHYPPPWYPKSGPYPETPVALEDAQRTLGLVRFHAAEWQIDPHKIGVIGFSAGGHLVAAMSTHFEKRLYAAVDAADKESCRPDFAVAVYPGHLWNWTYSSDPKMELIPDIATNITRLTPPTFLLQSEDDKVDNVNQVLVYYVGLKNEGVPVEMHLYAQGGHGFGLRAGKLPVAGWPQLVEKWLGTIGMTSQ
jgi:acetyl esterase/lipase